MLSVLTVLLVPAAIAWACNPQAHMKAANGGNVGPGGSLSVAGTYFQANNDLTLSLDGGGNLTNVRTNSGGAFTATIQAPSQPGSYTLLAKNSNGAARSGLPARLSFQVAAPSSAAPSPQAGQPPASAAPRQSPSFNEPSVTRSPAQDGPSSGGREQPSGGREQAQAPAPEQPAARSPETGGSDSTTIIRENGQQGFADSAAPSSGGTSTQSFGSPDAASPANGSQAEPAPGAPGRSSGTPSEQAAGGDVWSGFGSGSSASLLPSATDAAPESGTDSGFGWGIALLGLGLVALASGVAVAEVRRRRALAGS